MSVFAVAPSVQFTERDATLFVKASMNVNAAFAGVARWGAVDEPIHITAGEQDLVNKIYSPNGDTYLDFFVMADYLRYSQELMFLRQCGPNARNSVNSDAANAPTVKNKEDFENASFVSDVKWIGRYPGTLGNSIAIHVVDKDTFDKSEFKEYLNYKPQDGEYTVALVDTTGAITGGAAAVKQQEKISIVGLNATGASSFTLAGKTINVASDDTPLDVANTIRTQLVTDGSEVEAVVVTEKAGVRQVETVALSGTAIAGGALTVGGVEVTIADGDTATSAADKIATAVKADANYSDATSNEGVVTITRADFGPTTEIEVTGSVDGLSIDDIAIATPGVIPEAYATITFKEAIRRDAQVKPDGVDGLSYGAEVVVTGSLGTLITKEVYEVLQNTPGAKKTTGANAYYYEVIKNGSDLVFATTKSGLTAGTTWLEQGVDDYDVKRNAAYKTFENTELYDVTIVCGVGDVGEQQAAADCSNVRRDSITFMSPQRDDVVGARGKERDNVIKWRNEELLRDHSYMFLDDNWAVVYDKYNDTERLIPACGGTAGLYARAIQLAGPWKSPAFLNRGKYLGYRRMAWKPNATDRKELYKNQINSIVTRKEGIILWGDKTGLSRPSAFGHINVRGTFIMMEKNIANMAEYFLGENNDVFTRSLFTNTVRPYLRDLESRGAILEGKVKCDETNNTGQVIATNQMVAGIWIKPQYSINWIYLDFAALRPDMSFEELEGAGGITAA